MLDCARIFLRRKVVNMADITATKLDRCLSTVDLTFLGLCYAEFGARVPKTGSAYVYSYVTVGEFAAFVIGWNLVLEYVIGTSSVARAISLYMDSLMGNPISHYLRSHLPMNVSGLSPYPDLFTILFVALVTVMLAIGVKESSTFNNIFTCVNLFVVVYVIVCGLFKLDAQNWRIPPDQVPDPDTQGKGGFFPYGVSGMLSGAATCFYAFVGFDIIATTGEEVRNPRRAVPVSIVTSLTIISFAYIGISITLTMISPYYAIDRQVPLPDVFDRLGWTVARYVIAVGAVAGLSTSLLGAMFPLPRVLYAMAEDGIIFEFLAKVNPRSKTPLVATVFSGIFSGLMACMFDLRELVNMMSIGTLLAYTLVAECVLLLRYYTEEALPGQDYEHINAEPEEQRTSGYFAIFSRMPRFPTDFTMKLAIGTILAMTLSMICFCAVIIFAISNTPSWWAITLAVFTAVPMVTAFVFLCCQPQNRHQLSFKVPFVPLLPCLSIFVNTFLMLKLPTSTWIRFGVWMAIGFAVYFGYGVRHSTARETHVDDPVGEVDQTLDDHAK